MAPNFTIRIAVLSLAFAVAERSQAQASLPAPEQPVQMNPVVVTGSNLPSPVNESTKQVSVIGSVQVADSGEDDNLAEILRKTSTEFSGNGSLGLENANSVAFFTQGGSALQIHNLATLVLINGRRVAFDPAEAGLGNEFVDLNMIPPSAVDRIEIVSDGASAIYGSDAVGGVINVILKSNFNGWEAGVHWGEASDKGGYTERSGFLSGGAGNSTTSVMVSVEGTETSPIYMGQRRYSNPIYGATSYPGSSPSTRSTSRRASRAPSPTTRSTRRSTRRRGTSSTRSTSWSRWASTPPRPSSRWWAATTWRTSRPSSPA